MVRLRCVQLLVKPCICCLPYLTFINNGVSFGIVSLCNANSSGHCGLVLCFSVKKHAFDAD